ncbi:MAG: hypothetical protein GYA17_09485 [Chloroflexi bacterium]|nr:hypothetical protein [Chloroflexota bacterium]
MLWSWVLAGFVADSPLLAHRVRPARSGRRVPGTPVGVTAPVWVARLARADFFTGLGETGLPPRRPGRAPAPHRMDQFLHVTWYQPAAQAAPVHRPGPGKPAFAAGARGVTRRILAPAPRPARAVGSSFYRLFSGGAPGLLPVCDLPTVNESTAHEMLVLFHR